MTETRCRCSCGPTSSSPCRHCDGSCLNCNPDGTAEKRCPTCDTHKPLDFFGRDKHRSDGRNAICKNCRNEKAAENYAANPQAFIARNEAWRAKNYEKTLVYSKRTHENAKRNDPERVKAQLRAAMKRYVANNPEKTKARNAVSRAIKSGRLVRPEACSICFEVGRVEFDHCNGYDEPNWLVGQWVCKRCHVKAGKGRGEYVR